MRFLLHRWGHEANIRFIFGNSALSSTLFDVERWEFPAGCALANISLFELNSWSSSLGKLIVAQIVQKPLTFYGIPKCISTFTRALTLSLS
jgi:hypothetical protein